MSEQHQRKSGVAKRYGICTRSVDRKVENKQLPPPDFYLGKLPLWSERTLDRHDRAAAKKGRSEVSTFERPANVRAFDEARSA